MTRIVSIILSLFFTITSITVFINLTSSQSQSIYNMDSSELNTQLDGIANLPMPAMADSIGIMERNMMTDQPDDIPPIVLLYIKMGFSFLFGASALYIILSQKYNEETQKWAFSILSLISGIWLGTIA